MDKNTLNTDTMNFNLIRFAFRDGYTIGRLYREHTYLCDTLEPRSAHISSQATAAAIQRCKDTGVIAIPTGRYAIRVRLSHKFGRYLPELQNVTGFSGILIHAGNYPADTRGCILPGWNRRAGMVCGSRSAMEQILTLCAQAVGRGEEITITVTERRQKNSAALKKAA